MRQVEEKLYTADEQCLKVFYFLFRLRYIWVCS